MISIWCFTLSAITDPTRVADLPATKPRAVVLGDLATSFGTCWCIMEGGARRIPSRTGLPRNGLFLRHWTNVLVVGPTSGFVQLLRKSVALGLQHVHHLLE